MLRRWWLSLPLVVLFCSILLARDGVIQTNDGQRISGDITDDPSSNSVSVIVHGIALSLPRGDILSIQYKDDLEKQFSQRLSQLAPTDIRRRLELSRWALDQNLFDDAREAALSAQKVSPENIDVILMLRTIDAQEKLQGKTPAIAPATAPSAAPVDASAPADAAPALLSADDVNALRQAELRGDDNVQIRFDNDVLTRYVKFSGKDPRAFLAASPVSQALQILDSGQPDMIRDVAVLSDPIAISDFRRTVSSRIMNGCASSGCHGGGGAGNFQLYPIRPADTSFYTDFYILQTYQKKIDLPASVFGGGPTVRRMVDRAHPALSLLIQYGLPVKVADTPHPQVPYWQPIYTGDRDPGYKQVIQWMSRSLKPFDPQYSIQYPGVAAASPATAPSPEIGLPPASPAPPATQP
jgi:hypothetical protein